MSDQDPRPRRMPPEPEYSATATTGGSAGSQRSGSETSTNWSTQSASSTSQGDSGQTSAVGEQAGCLAESVSQQAGQVKDQLAQQVDSQAGDRKQQVASQMSTLASAMLDAGSSMRDQSPQMAQFAEAAAGRLQQWSADLERKDLGELVDDVEQFARDSPAIFIGGAFVLGLLGARFLKSSAPSSNMASGSRRSTTAYGRYSYAGASSGGSYSSRSSGTGWRPSAAPTRETSATMPSTWDVTGHGMERGADLPTTDSSSHAHAGTSMTDTE